MLPSNDLSLAHYSLLVSVGGGGRRGLHVQGGQRVWILFYIVRRVVVCLWFGLTPLSILLCISCSGDQGGLGEAKGGSGGTKPEPAGSCRAFVDPRRRRL